MSDFLGILITGDTVLHLLDYDKPVWLKPNDSSGLRVIPSREHFVADGLFVFKYNGLDQCGGSCGMSPAGLNDLTKSEICSHISEGRKNIYKKHQDRLIFLKSSTSSGSLIAENLAMFRSGGNEIILESDVAKNLGLT